MDRQRILRRLWHAMGSLYDARYMAAGPEKSGEGLAYPEMDQRTFSEIATLQDGLQSLITRLKTEQEKADMEAAKVDLGVSEEWIKATPWEQFQRYETEDSGMSHYLQAELIAVHKAMEVLKGLPAGEKITYKNLLTKAVEFANQFPGIGAKYRDANCRMYAMADYGLVEFDGDPEKWDECHVRLTAKGYLARPEEWYTSKPERAAKDPDADLIEMLDKEFNK